MRKGPHEGDTIDLAESTCLLLYHAFSGLQGEKGGAVEDDVDDGLKGTPNSRDHGDIIDII
jgi:hypothetical protein